MNLKTSNRCVFSIGYHLIWCTKYRRKAFVGPVEVELKRILAETCCHYGWDLTSVEVMPEHVHLFVEATPNDRPVDIVKTLKSCSAIHLFSTFPDLKRRQFWGKSLWSKGAYYASVGHISDESVKRYIEEQKDRK